MTQRALQLLIASTFVIAGCAVTAEPPRGSAYQQAPQRFTTQGVVAVKFVSDPDYECRALGANPSAGFAHTIACYASGGIVIEDPREVCRRDPTQYYACYLGHEAAHALGRWPGDHPEE